VKTGVQSEMKCHTEGCNVQPSWFRTRLMKQSGYVIESQWHCSDACLRKAILARLKQRRQSRDMALQGLLRLKLGHILLDQGVISREQLETAIATQREERSGERLGSILKTLEFVKERDVTTALSRQYGLPVVNLTNQRISQAVVKMVPPEIVRQSKFFPLEYDNYNNSLVVVTCDPGDVSQMINLRSILECDVTLYLSDESIVRGLQDEFCRLASEEKVSEEALVTKVADDLSEMADFIVRKAKALGATSLSMRYFNDLLWARFTAKRKKHDVILNAA